jgi:hypothetical protein
MSSRNCSTRLAEQKNGVAEAAAQVLAAAGSDRAGSTTNWLRDAKERRRLAHSSATHIILDRCEVGVMTVYYNSRILP